MLVPESIIGIAFVLISLCALRIVYFDWKADNILPQTESRKAITAILIYDEILSFVYQVVFVAIVVVIWQFPDLDGFPPLALAFLSLLHGFGTLKRLFDRKRNRASSSSRKVER